MLTRLVGFSSLILDDQQVILCARILLLLSQLVQVTLQVDRVAHHERWHGLRLVAAVGASHGCIRVPLLIRDALRLHHKCVEVHRGIHVARPNSFLRVHLTHDLTNFHATCLCFFELFHLAWDLD